MFTNAVLISMGALDGKEPFAIEGSEKLALNSGTTWRSAKNVAKKSVENLPHRRHNCPAESRAPTSVANWNVH